MGEFSFRVAGPESDGKFCAYLVKGRKDVAKSIGHESYNDALEAGSAMVDDQLEGCLFTIPGLERRRGGTVVVDW